MIKIIHLDTNEKLKNSNEGWAIEELSYDNYGNVIENKYFDETHKEVKPRFVYRTEHDLEK